ncbi:type VI secretion system contractile sheath small subunit [Mesoterricola silvestris]|uniref:Type VI secretion system-associated protein n=1 Tax=Mesoterricola silvestris TaxID=2927979 RepID=A0AA48GPH7_9BACT|nr:type VI secretion system contractile sheath small subunit [Mesoterricola silvestris]BDU73724.1 type VI secretion system-associated protein [Mesoterricola silvestris]
MSQESTIAPKERVNIVYRPATGDAKEEVELPLKVLVMGDFTQRADGTPLEDRSPVNVDKETFDEVLKAQKLRLEAQVPDKLSGTPGGQLSLNLEFRSLKDFEPDAIIQKVPELQKLMELREAIKALKGPLGNVPEFRRRIQELIEDPGSRDRILRDMGID